MEKEPLTKAHVKVAIRLTFDDAGAGGPKVDIEFDAALTKEVSAP